MELRTVGTCAHGIMVFDLLNKLFEDADYTIPDHLPVAERFSKVNSAKSTVQKKRYHFKKKVCQNFLWYIQAHKTFILRESLMSKVLFEPPKTENPQMKIF